MRLKNIRENKGISQKSLADFLCLSNKTIYNYESGKREPSIEMLKKLSLVLECTIDELVSDDIV